MYDRLEAAIHGTRKASPQWQDFSAGNMREMNFDRSDSSPHVYRDPDWGMIGEEHGDDFLMVGEVSMVFHGWTAMKRQGHLFTRTV